MKHTFLLIAMLMPMLFVGHTARAQNRPAEEKGKELLRLASEKVRSYRSLRASFTYEMDSQGVKERMDGILYTAGDKYHMKVGENIFMSDGTTSWTILGDLDEVHIDLVANADGGITPTALLAEFESGFRATFIRQERVNGRNADLIDLVPSQTQAFFKYRLAIDAADQSLIYTIAYDRSGGTYTYRINRLEPNVSIPPSLFVFNRANYPGMDIIDLR